MSDWPYCFWQLDCLLALTVSPNLDCTVVSTSHNLTSFKTINCKNEASVATIIQHMSSIHRPQLDNFIIRNARKSIHQWNFAEPAHNIVMTQKLFLQLPIEPQPNLLVLTPRNCNSIRQREDRNCVRMTFKRMFALSSFYIPNFRGTVPRARDQLIWDGLR